MPAVAGRHLVVATTGRRSRYGPVIHAWDVRPSRTPGMRAVCGVRVAAVFHSRSFAREMHTERTCPACANAAVGVA